MNAQPMIFLLGLAMLGGCARQEMYDAPINSQLQIRPSALTVGKSLIFYEEDNAGMFFFVDAYVTSTDDADAGMPLGNIRVEAYAPSYGVYVMPGSAVSLADIVFPDNWDQIKNDECYDENGNFTSEKNDLCAFLADEATGDAYEVSEYFDGPGGFAPNWTKIETNPKSGFARFWVFVDALPFSLANSTDGSFDITTATQGDATVMFTTSVSSTNLTIQSTN